MYDGMGFCGVVARMNAAASRRVKRRYVSPAAAGPSRW